MNLIYCPKQGALANSSVNADNLEMHLLGHTDRCQVSVVRRFGGEPQLMSNGNRCPMDLMSTERSEVDIKSIGHRFPLDINCAFTDKSSHNGIVP